MNLFKALFLKHRIKRAIQEANEMRALTGHKHLVFMYNGKVTIKTKQNIKTLIRMRKFAKGVTIADFEKRCLHITY